MSEDVNNWLLAAMVMTTVSLFVFLFQHLVTRVFDPVFELCVFYIPTIILIFIYKRLRK